jgi:TonB family protein
MSRRTYWALVAFLVLNLTAIAQSSPETAAANTKMTTASLGQQAASLILSQYLLDPSAKSPVSGKALTPDGTWTISESRPPDCPSTSQQCVTVFYTEQADRVTCSRTVLLANDGSSGKVFSENEDAARYMLVRLSQSDLAQYVEKHVTPVYPPIASAAHVSGDVALQIWVGENGSVKHIAVLSGPPMLQEAAIDGVKQWKFKPLLIGLRPARYQTSATIAFRTGGFGSNHITITP